jgi:hypothetical protein
MKIPAGEAQSVQVREYRIPQDSTVVGLAHHMHTLGSSIKAELVREGQAECLVDIPRWDFNWQLVYTLKQPLEVKRGSRLVVNAVYDNSTENPNNPNDPPRPITWGEETTDEMALLVVGYSVNGGGRQRR